LFAPDNVTAPLQLIGRNNQRESVGNKKRAHNFECFPVSERLRTIQSIRPPPDSIDRPSRYGGAARSVEGPSGRDTPKF
jgi:hypothetical protein